MLSEDNKEINKGMYQITEEEYEKAQRIIDEYHRERQQQADWELEEDDDEWNKSDDGEFDENDGRLRCGCGAYDGVVKVSDCICGAA